MEYFENYLLEENMFLFGNEICLVDLLLFGSLLKMFQFFFNDRIRSYNFANLSKWFKKIADLPEITSAFGSIKLCRTSWINLCDESKSYENLFHKGSFVSNKMSIKDMRSIL